MIIQDPQEYMKSEEFKKLPALKRLAYAVKNMSPERILYNKFWGQFGACVGLLAAIVWLIFLKTYWLLCFMPFIWFVQLLGLLETWQQLKQVKAMQEQLKALKEGNET